jgi:hypothetical protein
VRLKELFTCGSRLLERLKFGFDKSRTDAGDFRAKALGGIRLILQASGCGAKQPHGEDAALVGIHAVSSAEHGFFAGTASGTKEREHRLRSQVARRGSCAIKVRKPGSDGPDAGAEGGQIHVAVGTAVVTIDEAGLGSQLYFLEQSPTDQRANSAGTFLEAISRNLRRDEPDFFKACGRHRPSFE